MSRAVATGVLTEGACLEPSMLAYAVDVHPRSLRIALVALAALAVAVAMWLLVLAPDPEPAAIAEPTTTQPPATTSTTAAPPPDPWITQIAVATVPELQVFREIPDDALVDQLTTATTLAPPPTTDATGALQITLTPDQQAQLLAQARLREDAHALLDVEAQEDGSLETKDLPPPLSVTTAVTTPEPEPPTTAPGEPAQPLQSPAPTITEERGLTPIPSENLNWGSLPTEWGWSFTSPTPSGNARVFIVTEHRDEWVRIMLPTRPNSMLGWARADDMELAQHRWHVQISVSERMLRVWDGDRLELETLVVVGKDSSPTPLGRFYVNERVPQAPGSFYGPWIFSTNGFSDSLERFTGEVPIFALHGGGYPSTIGSAISNGCIRIPDELVEHMATLLPVGTPVDVFA